MKVKQCSVESLKMKTRGVNQLNFCRNRIFFSSLLSSDDEADDGVGSKHGADLMVEVK